MMIHVHQFARGVPIEEPSAGTKEVGGRGSLRASRKTRPVKIPVKACQPEQRHSRLRRHCHRQPTVSSACTLRFACLPVRISTLTEFTALAQSGLMRLCPGTSPPCWPRKAERNGPEHRVGGWLTC